MSLIYLLYYVTQESYESSLNFPANQTGSFGYNLFFL